jgi:hypothetical protein
MQNDTGLRLDGTRLRFGSAKAPHKIRDTLGMTQAFCNRPALALRVGITGTRDRNIASMSHVPEQLHAVLRTLHQQSNEFAKTEIAIATYQHALGEKPHPKLRILSPLARGADRLAARAALDEGYELHVPMPFSKATYELDFDTQDDKDEFQSLLHWAGDNILELDGDRDHARDRSYEAAGRYVVRNCDLLLAVWDGDIEGNGRGGTAEIVRYAAATGVPIWWIHATENKPPAWLADIQDLRNDPPHHEGLAADQALCDYIAALITPPPPCKRKHHGLTDCVAHVGHGPIASMPEYFQERERGPSFWVWKAHARFLRFMAGLPRPAPYVEKPRPEHPVAAFWWDRYRPADHLAVHYANRYRSGYVWTFLFATLSVTFGASALVCALLLPADAALEAWAARLACAELAMLALIFCLVGWGMRRDWHEHSIEFRLLAELCRKQQALGPLGWTLPIVDVRGLTDAEDLVPERGVWVAWLFAAEQRAAPFPTGALAAAAKGPPRTAILDELIAEQRAYHADRAELDGRAGHNLASWGEWLFFAVAVCVVAKLVLELATQYGAVAWRFGLLATILPAFSAAFVGIRAYAEVPLMASQSRHMVAALDAAHRRVTKLNTNRPLASQDLGAEAAEVATLMLQDLEGWARLFRVKSLETGG